jgi:serine/threonine protein kinase
VTQTIALIPEDTIIHQRYRIVQAIGQGGMGAVYEAVDQRLSNTVALKQTLMKGEYLGRAFKREAQMLAGMRHPALPRVIDYFTDEQGQFLVMEFFRGPDLGQLIDDQGVQFSVEQILAWGDQLLDALHYLHTQNPPIIHRDIKPQNLKPTQDGGIVLLDFGLAKGSAALQTHLTSARSIVGYTPQYAPPEQIDATGTDERSDLYSLSATLYRMFTGHVPTPALERLRKQAYEKAETLVPAHTLNAHVPPRVSAVLAKGMELDPRKRYATASEMREALKFASAGVRKARPRWVVPVAVGSVVVVVLLVLGIAFVSLGSGGPSESVAQVDPSGDTIVSANTTATRPESDVQQQPGTGGAPDNEPTAVPPPTETPTRKPNPTATVIPTPTATESALPVVSAVDPSEIYLPADLDEPIVITVSGQRLDQYTEIMIYDERTGRSQGRRLTSDDAEQLTFQLDSSGDLPAPPDGEATYIIELRGGGESHRFSLLVRDFIESLEVQGVNAEYTYTGRVAVEEDTVYTRMRQQPDAASEPTVQLYNGDTVQILQEAGDWYQARVVAEDPQRNGQIWWIERWLIEDEGVPPAPTPTPIPPTAAPIPPTAVPQRVQPTAAPVAPTAAPVAPTATPVAPTSVPVQPIPPTAAPVVPTPVPELPPGELPF